MSTRSTFFYTFVFICALVAFSFYLQADGFVPCPLCLLQRFTLMTLGVLFFIAWLFPFRKFGVFFFSFLTTIASAIGILLSGRQVWLQHTPGAHVNCGASLEYMLQAFPLKRVFSEVFTGSAECTLKGWQFLSLSLAEWSLICFCILLFISFLQMFRGLHARA